MAKKNYESPKMDEVKVNVEQDLLAGSTCTADAQSGTGNATCEPGGE